MNENDRVHAPIVVWATAVALLLIAPTLVVIPLSFTDKRSFAFPNEGWSTQWYRNFFEDPRWLDALGTSLRLALVVGLVATVVGTLAALGLDRTRSLPHRAVRALLMLPIVVPGIVAAVAVFGSYLDWGLSGTFTGLALAHIALAVPFVVIAVSTALRGFDPTLDRAATVLGAGPVARFLQVKLPIIAPGVVTGFVFAFVTSLDEVVIAYFLQAPDLRTLPVQMYGSVTVETDPSIAVASSLVLVVSTLIILVPGLVVAARGRRAAHRKDTA